MNIQEELADMQLRLSELDRKALGKSEDPEAVQRLLVLIARDASEFAVSLYAVKRTKAYNR